MLLRMGKEEFGAKGIMCLGSGRKKQLSTRLFILPVTSKKHHHTYTSLFSLSSCLSFLSLTCIDTHTQNSVMLFSILMLPMPPHLYLEMGKKFMWINCSWMQLKIARNRWVSATAAFAIQSTIFSPFSSRPPSRQSLPLQIILTSLPDSSSGENQVYIYHIILLRLFP